MNSIRKILIVDDELLARERIHRLLNDLCFTGTVEHAHNGVEALDLLRSDCFDLVFLDIQMPGPTGFEVLQQLQERNFQVIFQTAYDEFAIKAFDENACDYLLKPFSKERFEISLTRAVRNLETNQKLSQLEDCLHKQSLYLESLVIKHNGKSKILSLDRVDCFISEDHYTIIHSEGAELISDLSLAWLEQRINPHKFIRCHRNNIVAIVKIKCLGKSLKSEVELICGIKVPLSRRHRKNVLKVFDHGTLGDLPANRSCW